MKLRPLLLMLCAAALFAAGCGTHQQSMTNAAGTQAALIERLWWVVLLILSAIFVAVVAFLMRAVRRAPPGGPATPEAEVISPERDRRMSRVILVLVAAVVLFELGFLVAASAVEKRVRGPESKNPVEIHVIGHQWWWEFRYPDPVASETVFTANQLHIPVGMPVLLKVTSHDVIHSFWAPNLAGKRDLIPGYRQSFWIQAEKEGVFRGQCAEFCGHQHAHMSFYVVVESPEKYRQWLEAQRRPAAEPASQQARHGLDVFLSSPCVTCHTIRGTDAAARVGPELTHLASRSHIGAGTLPLTRDNLRSWIRDAQHHKPGNRMPAMALSDEELEALVTYLESLH